MQVRRVYDEFLAEALPELTEEQLVSATPKLMPVKYSAGDIIVRQGDLADKFYIITKGQVEVVREQDSGQELVVTRLGEGQYFGEIGLMHGGKRMATIRAAADVEVLALDRNTFSNLMAESEMSREEMDRVTRQRLAQVRALETGNQ